MHAPAPTSQPAPAPAAGTPVYGRRQPGLPRTASGPVAAPASNGAGFKYSFDVLRVAMLLLMLLTIGRMHQYYEFLMPLRPALLLALVASAYAIMVPASRTREKLLGTWPAQCIAAIAIMSVLSALFGISLGQSVNFILDTFSKVLLFWFLLMLAIRNVSDLSLMVWGFLGGAAFLCYLSIFFYQVVEQFGSAAMRLDDEHMFMYDPNDLGVILVPAILLALLTLQTSRWKGKLASVVLLLAIGWTMARGGSRGGFLGMGAVAILLFFLAKSVSMGSRMTVLAALVGAITIAAPAGYWVQMSTIFNLKKSNDYNLTSEDGRKKIWLRGLGYMASYPVFGVGVDNFGRAEGTISDKARQHVDGALVFTAPHNSFVQAGAEMGVPGLIVFASVCVGGFVGLLRLRRRIPPSWANGPPEERFLSLAPTYMAVAWVGFIVTAFFVSFAYLDPFYIFAAFTAAIYTFVNRRLAQGAGGGPGQSSTGAATSARRGGRGR